MHEQGVCRGLEVPGPPRPSDPHRDRIHGDGHDSGEQRLGGRAGTIAANIRTTAPIQEIAGETLWLTGIGAQWKERPSANAVYTM